MARVLVVDDEEGIRSFIGEVLEDEGHTVFLARDGVQAAQLLDRGAYHLLITDMKMPRMGGMELLRKARSEHPEMEAIVLTAHGTVETAVEAMKLGAFDYLAKPLSGPTELRLLAQRALEHRRLRESHRRSRETEDSQGDFIAHDPAMTAVLGQLEKVAVTEATVLLLGESGTGKEVAARAIHRWSTRRDGPFIAVNCAVMSETLLESEMFGHEKGAFTGADARRRGRVEQAEGGTLFLDEIAEMKPELQAKLLRVLQEGQFDRVGGSRTIEADVRWVAATNRDLSEEIAAGRFREDLYHRLAVFPIWLPPLRERPGDIIPLAEHLLARSGAELGRPGLKLAADTEPLLRSYPWPGNVRELGNTLERAAILTDSDTVSASSILLQPARGPVATAQPVSLADSEKRTIEAALQAEDGNRKRAASRLGIAVRTLYDKLKQYDLK